MQKNCHEFIAYENLTSSRGRSTERGRPAATNAPIAQALPLVKRALKVLSEREVAPQLGLLKSTLLQLDSTFSERDYGASSFRDFMEKVAQTGAVTLKHAGRSMLVESRENGAVDVEVVATHTDRPLQAASQEVPPSAPAQEVEHESDEEETLPPSPMSHQDGIRAVQQAFTREGSPPRWPMYVRQAKQFLRGAIENFDERKYGFASVVDLLRAAAKENVVRIERDRQGAVRVFPGTNLESKAASPEFTPVHAESVETDADVVSEFVQEAEGFGIASATETVSEPPIMEAETIPAQAADTGILDADEVDEDDVNFNREQPVTSATSVARRRAPAGARGPRAVARPAKARTPRPRARKSTRTKD
jgi:OST-HTH/LOTUS domain